MKESFICVKCQSIDIVKVPGGDNWTKGQFNHIKLTSMKHIFVTRYVCLDCGFSEEWIDKEKDLEKVAKYYKGNTDSSNFV